MSRSKDAIFYEKLARKVILPKGKTLTEVIMNYRRARKKQRYNLPLLLKISDKVDDVVSRDMHLFYMNVESESKDLVIYLHGGAYVDEILPFHWLMLDKITSLIDGKFIIPDYPLAPYHDFIYCYEKMIQFYRKVLEYYPDHKIILMGDSAGGGLAIGLSMYFAQKGLKVPDKLILLSPWVDLEMENEEIKDYLENDPILRYEDLKVDARYWANGHDLKDYRLSPLYGDVSCLKDVTLFTGTYEFFYPDIIRFGHKLEENRVKNRIFVGEKLYHVYPAFPIPEANDALRIIAQVIEDKL